MSSKSTKMNLFATKLVLAIILRLYSVLAMLLSYSGYNFAPTFYVRVFAEPDLLILAQLVRDPVFSQVSGETTARSRLKQLRCHTKVISAYKERDII